MALLCALTLLSWAGNAYAPPHTHRLRPQRLLRAGNAYAPPHRLRHCLRAQDDDDDNTHDDFDDSFALNDAQTGNLRLPTMAELMKRTDEKLLEAQFDTSKREALRQRSGESIVDGSRAVLEQLEDLESHHHSLSEEFTVAIVLGKALKDSRLSIEHAARVSTLVRQMKAGLEPSMLMFTASAASMAPGAVRDDATTACTYFLHLCESMHVHVDHSRIHVTHTPVTTRDGMAKVLEEAILPALPANASLHCAFFASDYQLTRLERIGSVTPKLSLFAPLAARREAYLKNLTLGGTTWSLEKVSYPPGLLTAGSDGISAAFLAQLYMIFDRLVPLLHNFHAIILHEEILSKEFYDDLLVAQDHISERLRLVDSPLRPATLRLRTTASTSPLDLVRADFEVPLDEALEQCVKNLGDLERLVRPAATRLDFLDEKDWRKARELLSRTINDARAATDPDRPLPSADWGRLVDRDGAGDLDLAELLELQRGSGWREDSSAAKDTSLASTGPLVLEYKTKRANTGR